MQLSDKRTTASAIPRSERAGRVVLQLLTSRPEPIYLEAHGFEHAAAVTPAVVAAFRLIL